MNVISVWINPIEAAEILGIGHATLKRYLAENRISRECAKKFGGSWRLKKSVLINDGLIFKNEKQATTKPKTI